jgi:molecular chaperone GrpE
MEDLCFRSLTAFSAIGTLGAKAMGRFMSAKKRKDSGGGGEERNNSGGGQDSPQSWEPEHLFEANQKKGEAVGIVDSLQQQVDSLRTQLARSQADFANLRKRSRDEQARTVTYANESLVSNLLPILDDFLRALAANNGNGGNGGKDFTDGMEMIQDRFAKILEQEGLEPVSTVGERFDPFVHEAVLTRTEDGAEPGSVLEECQAGYLFHGRLLRAAQVIVVPGKPPTKKKSKPKTKVKKEGIAKEKSDGEIKAEPEVEIEVEVEIEDIEAPPAATNDDPGLEFDSEKTVPTKDPDEALVEAPADSSPLPGTPEEAVSISEESENTFVSKPPSAEEWEMDEDLLDILKEDK